MASEKSGQSRQKLTASMPSNEGQASATQMYALAVAFALGSTIVAALGFVYSGLGCPSETPLLNVLCTDSHYKYLIPLLVPVTCWFAIANWVGWQYFRFA